VPDASAASNQPTAAAASYAPDRTDPGPAAARDCRAAGVQRLDMHDDATELDELFSATYEELRRLASAVRRDDPSVTLNPTALVNEAYLKLAGSLHTPPASRLHFKRIAARAMRQVLVEAARRRGAVKRGGDVAIVTFDESLDGAGTLPDEVLALDGALRIFADSHPRQAMVVEYRFFGGFNHSEVAEVLQVSEATIDRDWRLARAWLARALQRAS
jgi:RNA polymerase sigma factor (TIGR02999 family)